MTGHELCLPVDLLTGRPPDAGLPKVASTYVRKLFDRFCEVHHQVWENLKFSGEVIKCHYDLKASGHLMTDKS